MKARLLLASLFLAISIRADDWAPNITTTAGWNSNVTHTDRASDRIATLQLGAELLSMQRYPVSRTDAIHLSGHFAGDWWTRFDGLSTVAAGARAEWRHTFGTTPLAPVFLLEGAIDGVAAKESARGGVTTGITAALRKRFNDSFRGTLAHEVTRHDARGATFDRDTHDTSLTLDRELHEMARLSFTARFRTGDVISYAGTPRPELAALARHPFNLDTFGRTMTAYRIRAHTWAARVAFVRALNEQTAWILAYEWQRTGRGSLEFSNHLTTTSWVHQF